MADKKEDAKKEEKKVGEKEEEKGKTDFAAGITDNKEGVTNRPKEVAKVLEKEEIAYQKDIMGQKDLPDVHEEPTKNTEMSRMIRKEERRLKNLGQNLDDPEALHRKLQEATTRSMAHSEYASSANIKTDNNMRWSDEPKGERKGMMTASNVYTKLAGEKTEAAAGIGGGAGGRTTMNQLGETVVKRIQDEERVYARDLAIGKMVNAPGEVPRARAGAGPTAANTKAYGYITDNRSRMFERGHSTMQRMAAEEESYARDMRMHLQRDGQQENVEAPGRDGAPSSVRRASFRAEEGEQGVDIQQRDGVEEGPSVHEQGQRRRSSAAQAEARRESAAQAEARRESLAQAARQYRGESAAQAEARRESLAQAAGQYRGESAAQYPAGQQSPRRVGPTVQPQEEISSTESSEDQGSCWNMPDAVQKVMMKFRGQTPKKKERPPILEMEVDEDNYDPYYHRFEPEESSIQVDIDRRVIYPSKQDVRVIYPSKPVDRPPPEEPRKPLREKRHPEENRREIYVEDNFRVAYPDDEPCQVIYLDDGRQRGPYGGEERRIEQGIYADDRRRLAYPEDRRALAVYQSRAPQSFDYDRRRPNRVTAVRQSDRYPGQESYFEVSVSDDEVSVDWENVYLVQCPASSPGPEPRRPPPQQLNAPQESFAFMQSPTQHEIQGGPQYVNPQIVQSPMQGGPAFIAAQIGQTMQGVGPYLDPQTGQPVRVHSSQFLQAQMQMGQPSGQMEQLMPGQQIFGQHMGQQMEQQMFDQQMTGQQMFSQQAPGQQMTTQQMLSQQAPGQQMTTQQMPGQQMVSQQAPGQQMTTQQMPGQQMVSQQAPGQQMQGQQVPSQQAPGQQMTTQQMPGQQMVNQQAPDQQMQGQQVLSQQAPGQQIADQQNQMQQTYGQQMHDQHPQAPAQQTQEQQPQGQVQGQQPHVQQAPVQDIQGKQTQCQSGQGQQTQGKQLQGQPQMVEQTTGHTQLLEQRLPGQPQMLGQQDHGQQMFGQQIPGQQMFAQQTPGQQTFAQQTPGQQTFGQQGPGQQVFVGQQLACQQTPGQHMFAPQPTAQQLPSQQLSIPTQQPASLQMPAQQALGQQMPFMQAPAQVNGPLLFGAPQYVPPQIIQQMQGEPQYTVSRMSQQIQEHPLYTQHQMMQTQSRQPQPPPPPPPPPQRLELELGHRSQIRLEHQTSKPTHGRDSRRRGRKSKPLSDDDDYDSEEDIKRSQRKSKRDASDRKSRERKAAEDKPPMKTMAVQTVAEGPVDQKSQTDRCKQDAKGVYARADTDDQGTQRNKPSEKVVDTQTYSTLPYVGGPTVSFINLYSQVSPMVQHGSQMGGPVGQMGPPMGQVGGPMTQMGGPVPQMGGPLPQIGGPVPQMGGPAPQMGPPLCQMGGLMGSQISSSMGPMTTAMGMAMIPPVQQQQQPPQPPCDECSPRSCCEDIPFDELKRNIDEDIANIVNENLDVKISDEDTKILVTRPDSPYKLVYLIPQRPQIPKDEKSIQTAKEPESKSIQTDEPKPKEESSEDEEEERPQVLVCEVNTKECQVNGKRVRTTKSFRITQSEEEHTPSEDDADHEAEHTSKSRAAKDGSRKDRRPSTKERTQKDRAPKDHPPKERTSKDHKEKDRKPKDRQSKRKSRSAAKRKSSSKRGTSEGAYPRSLTISIGRSSSTNARGASQTPSRVQSRSQSHSPNHGLIHAQSRTSRTQSRSPTVVQRRYAQVDVSSSLSPASSQTNVSIIGGVSSNADTASTEQKHYYDSMSQQPYQDRSMTCIASSSPYRRSYSPTTTSKAASLHRVYTSGAREQHDFGYHDDRPPAAPVSRKKYMERIYPSMPQDHHPPVADRPRSVSCGRRSYPARSYCALEMSDSRYDRTDRPSSPMTQESRRYRGNDDIATQIAMQIAPQLARQLSPEVTARYAAQMQCPVSMPSEVCRPPPQYAYHVALPAPQPIPSTVQRQVSLQVVTEMHGGYPSPAGSRVPSRSPSPEVAPAVENSRKVLPEPPDINDLRNVVMGHMREGGSRRSGAAMPADSYSPSQPRPMLLPSGTERFYQRTMTLQEQEQQQQQLERQADAHIDRTPDRIHDRLQQRSRLPEDTRNTQSQKAEAVSQEQQDGTQLQMVVQKVLQDPHVRSTIYQAVAEQRAPTRTYQEAAERVPKSTHQEADRTEAHQGDTDRQAASSQQSPGDRSPSRPSDQLPPKNYQEAGDRTTKVYREIDVRTPTMSTVMQTTQNIQEGSTPVYPQETQESRPGREDSNYYARYRNHKSTERLMAQDANYRVQETKMVQHNRSVTPTPSQAQYAQRYQTVHGSVIQAQPSQNYQVVASVSQALPTDRYPAATMSLSQPLHPQRFQAPVQSVSQALSSQRYEAHAEQPSQYYNQAMVSASVSRTAIPPAYQRQVALTNYPSYMNPPGPPDIQPIPRFILPIRLQVAGKHSTSKPNISASYGPQGGSNMMGMPPPSASPIGKSMMEAGETNLQREYVMRAMTSTEMPSPTPQTPCRGDTKRAAHNRAYRLRIPAQEKQVLTYALVALVALISIVLVINTITKKRHANE
ncbi:uncharacterized protein LOC135370820 [Ornithodoros turicata]|uniref:uncharacterized protein LOC135370820 n=1 Tax=Ornithodoros turicata TaxID=34597 RepID=UPI00313A2B5F